MIVQVFCLTTTSVANVFFSFFSVTFELFQLNERCDFVALVIGIIILNAFLPFFQMFKRINEEKPEVLKKIVPIFGDITQQNFGLSDEQLAKIIQESEIVFHMAASLKLEQTLKFNVDMNLVGTKHAIDICKQMPKLMVFIHLSTAFCTSDEPGTLYERVYDWAHDPKEILRCNEWMDEATMELIAPSLLGPHPNTYTYTKRLAELLVRSEASSLPVCIVRPSIGKLLKTIKKDRLSLF